MQAKAMSFRGMADEKEGRPPHRQKPSSWTSNKEHLQDIITATEYTRLLEVMDPLDLATGDSLGRG